MKIDDDILEHIDGGWVVALVSFDISAAFDMVDHNLLLKSLSVEFGVTGAARDSIASYLRSRSFLVRIGQSSSSICSANAGIRQGSVLGPVLFTVYVSPIGRLIESLASSTTATLTTLNCTQHSNVTWDRISTNGRSEP